MRVTIKSLSKAATNVYLPSKPSLQDLAEIYAAMLGDFFVEKRFVFQNKRLVDGSLIDQGVKNGSMIYDSCLRGPSKKFTPIEINVIDEVCHTTGKLVFDQSSIFITMIPHIYASLYSLPISSFATNIYLKDTLVSPLSNCEKAGIVDGSTITLRPKPKTEQL